MMLQSAGSCAVTHLVASPMAKGLFHRAIAHSGSALNAWGTTNDPMTSSAKVATRAGCYDPNASPVMNKTEVARCMRAVDITALVPALYNYQVRYVSYLKIPNLNSHDLSYIRIGYREKRRTSWIRCCVSSCPGLSNGSRDSIHA